VAEETIETVSGAATTALPSALEAVNETTTDLYESAKGAIETAAEAGVGVMAAAGGEGRPQGAAEGQSVDSE